MHRGSEAPSADQQRSDLLYCISDEVCHKLALESDLLGAPFLLLISISAGCNTYEHSGHVISNTLRCETVSSKSRDGSQMLVGEWRQLGILVEHD